MTKRFPWLKFLAGIILFAFFHQLYDIFPSTWAAVLAEGEQETIFAHMKMLFYPYILISVVDYVLLRRKGKVPESFFYARLLILIAAPCVMISIFYVPDALNIPLEGPIELIFSILTSWVGVYLAIVMEEPLESITYGRAFKILIWISFITAVIIYTAFSFQPPHYEFFT